MSKRDYKLEIHDNLKGWIDTAERFKTQKAANARGEELVKKTGRFYRTKRASKNGR